MRRLLTYAAALTGILLTSTVFAQNTNQRGAELFELCTACHGPEGTGIEALQAPPIAGLSSEYIVRQIESFREGARGESGSAFANQMRLIALSLEEQAIPDVADFVAGLEPPPGPPPVGGNAERGRAHYEALCFACHGTNGEGNRIVDAPRLAGLPDYYLLDQLEDYREGVRGAHRDDLYGAQMRIMALALRDEQDVLDVVAYVATLEAPPAQATLTVGNPERGAATFTLCAACHGESAQGVRLLHAPPLAGQHDWYLLRQLEAFRTGLRGGDHEEVHAHQMYQIARILANHETLEDVVAYIASLNGAQ